MIFKPCGSFQLSGYQRVHLAGRWHSPSRSGGGQSILRERRKPVREEVTIRPVQGFPDPLSQLRRGVDVVGIPVGQRGDPIRQREGCRQRPDPRDYGQAGGSKTSSGCRSRQRRAGRCRMVGGRSHQPAIRGADPEGWGTPTVAASAGGVPRSFRRLRFMPGCIIRSTDARFCRSVPKCPAPSTLLRDRTEPGSACQRP
jgi:hypothetical protein